MVECQLPKLKVAGSNPVSRSKKIKDLADKVKSFFLTFVAIASVFASVWRKKLPEKRCAILNKFETLNPPRELLKIQSPCARAALFNE